MTGHLAKDCKENRKFDTDNIPDMSAEEAWAEMKKASDERDLDDFRKVFKALFIIGWARLTTLTSRPSKSTPRRCQMPRSWILKRKCGRNISTFDSMLWYAILE